MGKPTVDPDETQPGLAGLREAVARHSRRWIPRKAPHRDDAIAGLNVAIANVPDGLANGLLVGVNPVFGLYATMAGPIVGGLLASTRLMVITTTAAGSLTAAQALAGVPQDREVALFMMVALAGAIQVGLGVAGMGRLMRFVSYSVTTGFLTGIAVMLVLSQLPTITGIEASGGNRITQTIDLFGKIDRVDVLSAATATVTLLLAILLPRTPLKGAGRLVAIIVPSAAVALLGLDAVRTVSDIGAIPSDLPTPRLPSLSAAFDVLTGAFAISVVALVQGAGIGQSVPNPDGKRSDASRDFIAQGAANVVSGLFRGLPVGGSVSATALNVTAGARSRWAGVFAGIAMILVVIGAPALVGYIAMPALGALLVLAGFGSLRWSEIVVVTSTRREALIAGVATFVSTLLLPIQAAVGIGVVLSILLFVRESSMNVTIVELVRRADGRIEEREPPLTLPADTVTVLHTYGDLFYAAARTFEDVLPAPPANGNAVAVLRLRGRSGIGTTLIDVIERYASDLERSGSRLFVAGVSGDTERWLRGSAKLRSADVRFFAATPVLGESMHQAVEEGRDWLERQRRDADVTTAE